jgi:hypothetical protein
MTRIPSSTQVKKIKTSNNLILLFTLFGILTFIVLLPAILIGRYAYDDNSTKTFLLTKFQAINLPSSLTPVDKHYQGGGIDTMSTWRFTYSSTLDRTIVSKEVESALEQAGFITPNYLYSESSPAFSAANIQDGTSVTVNMGTLKPRPPYSGNITFDISRMP